MDIENEFFDYGIENGFNDIELSQRMLKLIVGFIEEDRKKQLILNGVGSSKIKKNDKAYLFKTIEDITSVVNKDNVSDLCADLVGVLVGLANLKEKAPDIKMQEIEWLDDGKRNITFELEQE